MSERLFTDLLGWLGEQKALSEGRQLVKLELGYAPRGFREEQLSAWVRKDEPEWFESQALTEGLVHKVIEIATNHADSFSSGEHRYVLRSYQHLAGTSSRPFKISTSMASAGGGEQEHGTGLIAPGSQASGTIEAIAGVLTQNNQSLMRTNQLMFESTFRTLTGMIQGSNEESSALKAENATLRRENEELRSRRHIDDFEIETQREERARKNRTGDTINQLLPVIAAKVMGGDNTGAAAKSALGMLVRQLKESLRPEQIQQMAGMLDQSQLVIFVNILQMVDQPADTQSGQAA